PHHRRDGDAPRHGPVPLRRDRDREHVRRHPLRPDRGAGGGAGARARREHRQRRGDLRGGARLGAGHRGAEHRQPLGAPPRGGDDAPAPRAARGGAADPHGAGGDDPDGRLAHAGPRRWLHHHRVHRRRPPAPVRASGRTVGTCRNCGRERPAERLDRLRWCDLCRREVVRRASVVARIAAFIGTLLLVGWVVTVVGPSPRFLVGWLVLIAIVYFFVYKLTQRIAFEAIRSRGVPPPPEPRA